ncbi:MAG: Anion-transporting ATPase, partial [Cryptosporangiaceae bacterium]|nr:Anion-transporting ATPase [Cryptosporangiaceae bacterium]
AAGLPTGRPLVSALAAEAGDRALRDSLEERLRGELAELDRPMIELPYLPDGVDLGGLYTLADAFCAQGVAAR